MVSLILTLSLTLHILASLLLTLNIFHILHDVKNVKIYALCWKKERKVGLTGYRSVFSPEYKTHLYISPPNIGPSNLSFVHIYAQGILTGFYGMYIYISVL